MPLSRRHQMPIRTRKTTVTFNQPFVLAGFDEVFPAGVYNVETDEELLENISFPVYRRKLTLLHLGARPGYPGITRTITIDPNELDKALKRDQSLSKILIGEITIQNNTDKNSES